MSDVTRILSEIEDGDPDAAEQLLPLVYDATAEAGGSQDGTGEPRPDLSRRPPWFTKRTSGWWTETRPSIGTLGDTSFQLLLGVLPSWTSGETKLPQSHPQTAAWSEYVRTTARLKPRQALLVATGISGTATSRSGLSAGNCRINMIRMFGVRVETCKANMKTHVTLGRN